jgi:uncharacterized protein
VTVTVSDRLRRIPYGGRTYLHASQVPLSFVAANEALLDTLDSFGAGRPIAEVAQERTGSAQERRRLEDFLRWLHVAGVLVDAERPDPIHAYTGAGVRTETLWLFPTNACNLRCVYCYASSGPGAGPRLKFDDAAIGIEDFFAGLADDVGLVKLQFHGGGEPTTAHAVLRDAWREFSACAAARNIPARASTITNGVFGKSVLEMLSEPEWSVMFSYDGPRQAAQRPSASGKDSRDRVLANMRALAATGKHIAARATLTAEGLDRMDDLIVDAAEIGLSAIQIEPASVVGRGSSLSDGAPDPMDFAEAYLESFNRGLEAGVAVSTAAFSLTRVGDGVYCGANRGLRAVTPDGHVSACTECTKGPGPMVGRRRDAEADPFLVGHVDRGSRTLVIIPHREQALRSRNADSLPHCSTCYMRDTCAGGCMSRARAQSGSIFERDAVNCVSARRINPQMAAEIADGQLVPEPGWLPLTAETAPSSSPGLGDQNSAPAGRLVAIVPPYARRPWIAEPDRRPFLLPPHDAPRWFQRPGDARPAVRGPDDRRSTKEDIDGRRS